MGRLFAAVGGAVWLGRVAVYGAVPSETHWAVTLLLLSPLVLLPLVLELLESEQWPATAARLLRVARWWQLPTALLLVVACETPPSLPAVLLCLPWFVVTGLIAGAGLLRLLDRAPGRSAATICCDFGLVYLPIGSGWLCPWRLGWWPLDFPEVIVMLTAIHFHYAGILLPLLTGWAAREVGGRVAATTCVAVVVGIPLLAVGITATHLKFPTELETAAALFLSAAGISAGVLQLRLSGRRAARPLSWVLWGVSGVSLVGAMVLSALYGLRFVHGWEWLDIPWMRAWHGTINAFGACLCGVAAWCFLPRRPAG